jgi:hypothetical protein
MRAVACSMQHHDSRVGGQPPLHDLGVVNDHVVADHRDRGRSRVGGGELFEEGDEVGADRLAGHLVEPPASVQVERAEDGAPPVLAWGHDLLASAEGDPSGPDPGQQVDMRLVLGQHDRALGQLPDGLVEAGQHRLPGGVTLGNQARPPPLGDLADPPVQSPQGYGGPAEPLIEPRDRPGPGLGQQPADPLGEPGAAQPGSAGSGPVGQPDHPILVVAMDPAAHRGRVAAQQLSDRRRRPTMVRQQDHDQAGANAVAAGQQPGHVAGQAAGQERLAYTLGERILSAASSGRLVWKLQRPTRLLRALPPTPPALRAHLRSSA